MHIVRRILTLMMQLSGGFAIVKEDGADVCVTEAVRVEDLDEAAVSLPLD